VSNVLAFRKHFKKAKIIVLSKNYRSTQSILDASYKLIQHNNPDRLEFKEHINKKLVSERKIDGVGPRMIYMDRVENEADEVAKRISEQVTVDRVQKKYEYKDFAILVRANAHAEPFVRALSRHGIPYQFLGPGQLFRQPEIKDLIAYLRLLQHFDDSVAFFRVLSMPFFSISARDIASLSNFAKRHTTSLFEAAENIQQNELFTDPKTQEKIQTIVDMVHRHLGLVTNESAGQILYFFLQDTGLINHILDYKAPITEIQAKNISKFFSKLKTFEIDHAEPDVTAVLDWIELSMALGESPLAGDTDWVQNNAVNILTIHSAKGLEFPVVFLVNLVSARFPTTERHEQIPIPDDLIHEILPEGDYHTQEERRLFYVGMTRARDILYLTAANFYGEGKREKKVSPFVFEVLGNTKSFTIQPTANQISLLDWSKNALPDTAIPDMQVLYQPITYLSYSQIDTFITCPLHYKLKYILHIPTPQTASLSFGTSMHGAMQEFYQLRARGSQVTKQTLLAALESHWLHTGYASKAYELEMKKRGERNLSYFFDHDFDPNANVLSLEQPFIVPLTLGNRTIKIGGRIDRVDATPEGKIEIIDYKTGKPTTQRDVDNNLQLSMYALAATEIPDPPFGKKSEDITLTLYYFETHEKISTHRSAKQLEAEKENIWKIVDEIETSDFHCSGNKLCEKCEYNLFCGL
jgi:DNA helicase II / ATP-dependent DNA helicase PcrA